MDIYDVILSRKALKQLKRLPVHIAIKLQAWVDNVAYKGLRTTRQIPGYHDEPLHGKRQEQRSIRLSKAYRAIYCVDKHGAVNCVEIVEVSKHDY